MPECIRACTEDRLLQLWKASATSDRLVLSGGAYRGLFMALRSIIVATNERIELPTDLLDKVIVIELDSDEGVDLDSCRGCTPRTMSPETREGVSMLGMKIIQKLNEKVGEVKMLQSLDRVEILRGLVRIGYNVWSELFKEYGLEPFPPPFTEDGRLVIEEEQFTEEERSRFSEVVEDFIKWYAKEKEGECRVQDTDEKRRYCEEVKPLIALFKESPELHYSCLWEKESKVCAEKDLEVLEKFGLIKISDVDSGKQYIAMTTAVFNSFIKFLKREYRMSDRDIERVRSALATKLTTLYFRLDRGGEPVKKKVYKMALS
jgi:hypothetical protein